MRDMSKHRGTLDLPTLMGWYVVWRKLDGVEQPPQLYFCVEASATEVSCMSARPSEDDEFLPVCHASFTGALWLVVAFAALLLAAVVALPRSHGRRAEAFETG